MNRNTKIAGLITIALIVLVYFAFTFLRASTKKHSPLEVAELQEGGLEIAVTYCRPYKKDRMIFGEEEDGALQPYGGGKEDPLPSYNILDLIPPDDSKKN